MVWNEVKLEIHLFVKTFKNSGLPNVLQKNPENSPCLSDFFLTKLQPKTIEFIVPDIIELPYYLFSNKSVLKLKCWTQTINQEHHLTKLFMAL